MTTSADALVTVDGVAFDSVTEDQVVQDVVRTPAGDEGGLIITANVDILRQLRKKGHQGLADEARMVVADGMPVVWASKLQGSPLPERVTGVDLVSAISAAAAAEGRSVYLLGAAPGVAERAAAALRQASPNLIVAGWASPPVGFTEDAAALEAVCNEVAACQPDIVFVALGFPKQERVSLELRKLLPSAWFLACGGAFDMASGDIARAPEQWQGLGGEWVYRLSKEPRRLARRYLRDDIPYTVGLLVRSAIRRRSRSARRPPSFVRQGPSEQGWRRLPARRPQPVTSFREPPAEEAFSA